MFCNSNFLFLFAYYILVYIIVYRNWGDTLSVQYGLLALLLESPRHGYELKLAFEERVGTFWELNYGQIYSTLDRLLKQGFVEWQADLGEGPDRKVYSITEKGKREFHSWLKKPVQKRKPLRDEFFLKLALSGEEDIQEMLDLINEQRQIYLQKMAQLTQDKLRLNREKKNDLVLGLLMDAALFHAEADVRWLEHAASKLGEKWRG